MGRIAAGPHLIPPEDRLTRKQAAALLGVSPGSMNRYERVGFLGVRLLPQRLLGKSWWSRESIGAFLLETERRRAERARGPVEPLSEGVKAELRRRGFTI